MATSSDKKKFGKSEMMDYYKFLEAMRKEFSSNPHVVPRDTDSCIECIKQEMMEASGNYDWSFELQMDAEHEYHKRMHKLYELWAPHGGCHHREKKSNAGYNRMNGRALETTNAEIRALSPVKKRSLLLHKDFIPGKNLITEDTITDKYGNAATEEYIPREYLLGQSEGHVEYDRVGRIMKGQEMAIPRIKYEEDIYTNNHTTVWGSWWNDHQWGYKCCKQLIRNTYCTATAAVEAGEASTGLMKANIARKEATSYGKPEAAEEKKEMAIPRIKYEEDIYVNNHTTVWGSWWNDHQWGYKCCKQLIRNSYCTRTAAVETGEASTDIVKANICS